MTAPLNAHDQLPSGLTLAALRERAVLFGGNRCKVPAPDLLCLLDALQEARGESKKLIDGWNIRSLLDHHNMAVTDNPTSCPPCAAYLAAGDKGEDHMRCDWARDLTPTYDAAHNLAVTAWALVDDGVEVVW